ncbi:hypothetical protein JCM8208_004049 [Rhodotorula glutinis]
MAGYTLTVPHHQARAPTWTARTAPLSRVHAGSWFLLVVAFHGFVLAGWTYYWCAAIAPLVLLSLSTRTTETITLLPSLGIQLSHKREFALFPFPVDSHQRLVPLERVHKVVINEGLQGAGGKAYLAVVEGALDKGSERETVHVVFPNILPRLSDLEPVRQNAQAMLTQ